MSKPFISVIVPCYNQAKYLDECLQSVIDQSFTDWECIIVDDGSPDNTAEVAKSWTNKDLRFKYLKKENGGLASARNAGIDIAKGEWILPLDSDDKIESQYLELAAKQFENNFTVIYCNAHFFGEKFGLWELPNYSLNNLAHNNVIFCSALFKKKDWFEKGGYDESMRIALEDWEFWIRLLKHGGNVYKIPEICFFYRIKDLSMINSLGWGQKEPVIKYIEKKHIDFFQQHIGTYHFLLHQNDKTERLIKENKDLKLKLNSKKYKVLDKILKFWRL